MTLAHTDMVGRRFGRIVVIEEAGRKKSKFYWKCICDCGNYKNVIHGNLIHNKTTSCGCFKKEMASLRFRKHGLTEHPLYSIWAGMRKRCHNKKDLEYKNYGGRGISICEEWNQFIIFYQWAVDNGYESGLSVDRIDVNGNYCAENCKWSTSKQQARNKRNTLSVGDELMQEVSIRLGGSIGLVRDRIYKLGWSVERALSEKKHERSTGPTEET